MQGFYYQRSPTTWPTQEEATRRIASLGLGVEVWMSKGEGDPDPDRPTLAAIRDAARGAPYISVHSRSELWSWNPAGLRREIALSNAVGARLLVLHRGGFGLIDPKSEANFPEIRRLAEEAREAGILLALENGRSDAWALDRVLDELGENPEETNLGICIDIGHAHLSTALSEKNPIRSYLERYALALVHLHLHDNVGQDDEHRVPGDGTADWRDTLETLRAIGYAGTGTFELLTDGDLLTGFARARSFLEWL
jgi:sugar phosphate isomerase/epimerase